MARRKSKHICAECTKWEMGDFWRTSMNRNPGSRVVVSEGYCKGTGKACWSCRRACMAFDKRKQTGFIMSGTGPMTPETLKELDKNIQELFEN